MEHVFQCVKLAVILFLNVYNIFLIAETLLTTYYPDIFYTHMFYTYIIHTLNFPAHHRNGVHGLCTV